MRWQLDQLVVEGTSNSEQILQWWAASFSASPLTDEAPDIEMALNAVSTMPALKPPLSMRKVTSWPIILTADIRWPTCPNMAA